jgi:hypothetical protein
VNRTPDFKFGKGDDDCEEVVKEDENGNGQQDQNEVMEVDGGEVVRLRKKKKKTEDGNRNGIARRTSAGEQFFAFFLLTAFPCYQMADDDFAKNLGDKISTKNSD